MFRQRGKRYGLLFLALFLFTMMFTIAAEHSSADIVCCTIKVGGVVYLRGQIDPETRICTCAPLEPIVCALECPQVP
jgi:hypothetical protein